MAKRSLFSILSEQPWWVSLVVAMALFAVAQLVFPPVAPFIGAPFIALAVYVGWKQLRNISPATVEDRLTALRAMPWDDYGRIVSETYRRQGYTVEESGGGAFDFRLRKDNRITLVQCRRWKLNQVGVKPVQELHEAMDKLGAFSGVCISTGEFTVSARDFATGKPVTLLNGAALAKLVGTTEKTSRRWFTH